MDKLDCINTFISVVEHGNFSNASRKLGITRDQVAKRICHLETIFNTLLFTRNTRKMELTYSGENFYQRSKVIISEYEWAVSDFIYDQKSPSGKLRINTPHSFRQTHLINIISKFMILYPLIKIDLFLSDNFSDINDDKFDIILRVNFKKNNEHYSHLFNIYHRYFYATPTYFEKHGQPKTLDDLKKHSLLLYSQSDLNTKIILTKNEKEENIHFTPQLTCNNGDFLLDFCKQNQGIIFLPDFIVAREEKAGNIVRCMEEYHSPPLYFYAITPSKQKIPKASKLFLDHLKKHLPTSTCK